MALVAGAGESISISEIALTNGMVKLVVDYPMGLGAGLDVFAHTNLGNDLRWRLAGTNLDTFGIDRIAWTNPATSPMDRCFYVVGNAGLDTDGDGLADARERYVYLSSPATNDSDGDGLVDGYSGIVPTNSYPGGAYTSGGAYVEGELTWQTDSRRADTDEDGKTDGWEVAHGRTPLAVETEIGSRWEPFVDLYLVQSMSGVSHQFHRPMEIRNLKEPPAKGCNPTVIYDDSYKKYRHYYRDTIPGYSGPGEAGNPGQLTAYEESTNGINWYRPNLGLFEVNGSRSNNYILANMPPFSHNFSPFLDTRPGCPAAQRYKALAGTTLGSTGLVAFASANGTNWAKIRAAPVLAPVPNTTMFDSQNAAFWSSTEAKYVAYCQQISNGVSSIVRATSSDFLTWSAYEQVPMNLTGEQIYTSHAQPYFRAPHITIGLASRSLPGMGGTNEIVLWTSRTSNSCDRTLKECYVRPPLGSQNWSSGTNQPALNVYPLWNDTPETMPAEWRYIFWEYMAMMVGDRIYYQPLDGFASINAPYSEGEMITKPIVFSGSGLYLNFATSANGYIRIEILDPAGQPIPGFALQNLNGDMRGNSRGAIVTWKSPVGTNVGPLAGRTIRLRVVLREADLYAIQFR